MRLIMWGLYRFCPVFGVYTPYDFGVELGFRTSGVRVAEPQIFATDIVVAMVSTSSTH